MVHPELQKKYENVQSKNFRLSVGPWHFEESIDLTDGRNVIGDEGFEFGVKLSENGGVSEWWGEDTFGWTWRVLWLICWLGGWHTLQRCSRLQCWLSFSLRSYLRWTFSWVIFGHLNEAKQLPNSLLFYELDSISEPDTSICSSACSFSIFCVCYIWCRF